jgi:protein disulfide-isomerase
MYEFYYTLDPLASSKSKPTAPDGGDDAAAQQDLNSFTHYYNFRFAKLDCVAFGTACSGKKIDSFPTTMLFKDGVEVKREVGTQSLKDLSKWVEETLYILRPGSRPVEGPQLPKVGAHEAPAVGKNEKSEQKDKDPEAGKKAGEKHNAVASSVAEEEAATSATETSTVATSKAVAKPKKNANVDGKSVKLTAESFQRLVTTTRDPWFVKFYAPWCGHCQAMAPNWASMARDMQGVLNVGEVNCEAEKRLCKDAKVKGYPTMLFFRGGERVEYEGLRGVGDLTTFAKKAVDVGTGVSDVSAAQFEQLEETEDVIFVYFYDHATTSEDFDALERLTLSLVGHAKLVKSNDKELYKRFKISTWPRLMVSRSGKPSYYPPLAPKDMRETRKVLNWMRTVWQPIVPELTAQNAHEVMSNKLIVLGILSRSRPSEFEVAKKELKNAALEWIDREANAVKLERQELRDAKQLRIEEAEDRNDAKGLRAAKGIRIKMEDVVRRDVRFMWVDGSFWERWIRTSFGVDVRTDGERVIIYDEGVSSFLPLPSTAVMLTGWSI